MCSVKRNLLGVSESKLFQHYSIRNIVWEKQRRGKMSYLFVECDE